jgi:alpha-ketoglutarate-dependent taurine dioxygenase
MKQTIISPQTIRSTKIEVAPLTPIAGARLSGFDIADVADATIAAVRSALLTHKVIFIRDQDPDSTRFLRFAERFGAVTRHHPVGVSTADKLAADASAKAKDAVWTRDNTYRSDHWHTDATFIDRPPAISILQCLVSPRCGGDTLFANTVAAYRRMPPALQTLADGLRAIHAISPQAVRQRGNSNSQGVDTNAFATEHPVVRVHSETNERSLLLGSFTESILGLTQAASTDLCRIFQDYITLPENVVRWSWRPGDVAMWDNRGTQHYAVNDYGDAPRLMQRLTIAGGIPVGTDGRCSIALRGDASNVSTLGLA